MGVVFDGKSLLRSRELCGKLLDALVGLVSEGADAVGRIAGRKISGVPCL